MFYTIKFRSKFMRIALNVVAIVVFLLTVIFQRHPVPQAQAATVDTIASYGQVTADSHIPTRQAENTLVPRNATWKYLDDGSNQGVAWSGTAFNDSTWASGSAELGYGDGDEATVVSYGPDPNNKHITTYFRHAFNVANASIYTGLLLRILRDDGAVIYLNGTEVFRTNMPDGSINHTTLASSTVFANETVYFSAMIDPSNLVNGMNVIAVEIHQVSGSSSDISFNLELFGVTGQGSCSGGTTRFAVIGDYGDAGPAELDVSNLVKSWNPSYIITVGDNNYPDGTAATIDGNIGQYYHKFIGNYSGSYGAGATSNNFYPSLGNHDWHTTSGSPPLPQPYLNYFTLPGNERYYNFTRGAVEFFAIDSDSGEPDGISSTSVQADWLKTQLTASSAPWKVVYLHHAPYSSGRHGSSTTRQWPYQAWGATAVLAGHDHTYERIILNGFPYFVNGLGGKSIYEFDPPISGSVVRYNGDYGAMLAKVNNDCLSFQFVSRTGTVIDTYTIYRTSSLTYIFLPLIFKN